MMSEFARLRVLNIVGYVVMIVVNILANALPLNGLTTEYISDVYPNLFVPAGFTFAIWGLIYLMLGVFVIYQARDLFRPQGEMPETNAIGYLFFLSAVLNAAWIFLWHYLQVSLSLLVMILLLATLISIHNRIRRIDAVNGPTKLRRYIVARFPFSIYLGWITVATIANVTAVLVHVQWDRLGLSEVFWTGLMLAVATCITLAFIYTRRDAAYSLIVLWAFWGIISKRLGTEPVETSIVTLAGAGMTSIVVGLIWLALSRNKLKGKPSMVL